MATNRKLLTLFLCAMAAITLVVSLYALTEKFPTPQHNFIRHFPPRSTHRRQIFDLGVNSYYFSGATRSRIYLGNYTLPNLVLEIDSALLDSTQHHFPLHRYSELSVGTHVAIDSPSVFFSDGTTASLLNASIQHPNTISLHTSNRPFSKAIPISASSFVVRELNDSMHQQILIKFDHTNQQTARYILEKQIDGFFCTDGMLLHVRDYQSILYSYFYRNQFILLDSNLNVRYKAHTIDTTSKASINILEDKSQGTSVLAPGSIVVNKRSHVNNNLLFIQSGIMAANEQADLFKVCTVIDVYTLSNGKYQFSFYLPDLKGLKVNDFIVEGKSLYVLNGQYLVLYQLNSAIIRPSL